MRRATHSPSEAIIEEDLLRLRALLVLRRSALLQAHVLAGLLHPRVAAAHRAVLARAAAQLVRLGAERLIAPRTDARGRLADLLERAGAAAPHDAERVERDVELRL